MSEEVALSPDEALETEHLRLDDMEMAMLDSGTPAVELPLTHRFTEGIYSREIFMPAGTLLTSKIHKVRHPYVILQGKVSVYIPEVGVQHLEAPYMGITEPGTRRVLYIHEDCTWVTFHPNADNTEDLDVIEDRLIERRELADGLTGFEHYIELLTRQRAELDGEEEILALEGQLDYMGAP